MPQPNLEDLRIHFPPSQFIRRFGDIIDGQELPGMVLDLGSGTGRNSRYLAGLGHTVLGITADQREASAARALAAEKALSNCEFMQGDITSLRLGQQFGAVLLNEVLHQIDRVQTEGLLEMARSMTLPQGYNAVSGYVRSPFDGGEYLENDELLQSYESARWDIVDYQPAEESSILSADSTVKIIKIATLIARRPS